MEQSRERLLLLAKAKAKAEQERQPTAPEETDISVKDMALGALRGAGKVLDYVPGYTRTALQKGADALTGGDAAGTYEQALGAEAQPWSEYLKKRGMEEGAGNSALGFGLDVVSDPTLLATGVAKLPIAGAAKLAALMKSATPLTALKMASESQAPLARMAELNAAKALGVERGTFKKMGEADLRSAGRQALDKKVITPLATTDDMIARNEAIKQAASDKMGEVYQTLDQSGHKAFNPLDVASKVEERLAPEFRDPLNKDVVNQLENTLESILTRGDESINLAQAQRMKQTLGNAAYPKPRPVDVSPKMQMARRAYGIVNESIDEAAQNVAKSSSADPALLQHLKSAKSQYGASRTAEDLLENKQAREMGNKLFGITDVGLGAGGFGAALMGHDPTAALLTAGAVGAKKFGEKYGRNISALGLDKASKFAGKMAPLSGGAYKLTSALPSEAWAKLLGAKYGEEE